MDTVKKKKALIILSGGQDSTTCAFWAKELFSELHAVTFNYGQRHSREIESARKIGELVGVVSHDIVDLGAGILKGTSPLVSDQPLEQYLNWQSLPGGLEKTFVPARNDLFFTLAANRAYCLEVPNLVTGICQEDFGGYPDCRESFRSAKETSLRMALDWWELNLLAPLMFMTKADTVKLAGELPGCMDALAYSHTAYDGSYPPVGHDHATLLRAKGFEEAGVADPLVLRAVSEGLMPLPPSKNYNSYRDQAGNAE